MHRDFVEMLSLLNAAGAEFLIVGAHALAAHGVPRATGDLDVWINPTPDNAARVWRALQEFGAPLDQLNVADLVRADVVFQIGVSPVRIDILTTITGVAFSDAWPNRLKVTIGSEQVPVLGREELIRNKRAVGRLQDLADIERLENTSE